MDNIKMCSRLLSTGELASYLGRSKSAIYSLVYRGQLPYVKMGHGKNGAIYFDLEQIEALIDSRTINAFKPVN